MALKSMIFSRYRMGSNVNYKENTGVRATALNQIESKIRIGEYTFVKVPCLCGAESFDQISEIDCHGSTTYVCVCKTCGLLQTNPRFSESTLSQFYNLEYLPLYKGVLVADQSWSNHQLSRGKKILSNLVNFGVILNKDDLIVEVGCGTGSGLLPFKELGLQTKGFDLSEDQIKHGQKEFGLDLFVGGTEKLALLGKKPKVVILCHVLEHFSNPVDELLAIRNCLDKDSLVYIDVPGITYKSDLLATLKNCHMYHFSRVTLADTVRRAGFKIEKIKEDIVCVIKIENSGESLESRDSVSTRSEYIRFLVRHCVYELVYKTKAIIKKLVYKNAPKAKPGLDS